MGGKVADSKTTIGGNVGDSFPSTVLCSASAPNPFGGGNAAPNSVEGGIAAPNATGGVNPAANPAPNPAGGVNPWQFPMHTMAEGQQMIGQSGHISYGRIGSNNLLTAHSMFVTDPTGLMAKGWQVKGSNQPTAGHLANVLASLKHEGQREITDRMFNSQVHLEKYIHNALLQYNGQGFRKDQNIPSGFIIWLRYSA